MTESNLATLLHDHVRDSEPPFALSADTSIILGRRTLLRRRARRGFTGVLVAAAALAAVPLLPWGGGGGDDRTGVDPLTAGALENYDATAMPALIEDHVDAVLARSGTDLGDADFSANDGQGESLPARLYDKASSMEVGYGAATDHRFRVSLMHSAGEAEGDARENCANDLADGYDFSCVVSTSPDGDPVTTRVMAVRPLEDVLPGGGWAALTREELRTGVPTKMDPVQGPIDPEDVYFQRMVEVVHSKTFLTTAIETVRAPDLAAANRLWTVRVADMESIVTDPELVIPKPPLGKGGCPWAWHADVSCE
jgi:hypothetical protein